MNNAVQNQQPIDPRASLVLLVQFAREYLGTLADRPATAGACEVQIKDAAERVDKALVDGQFAQAQLAELTKPAPPQAELPLDNPEEQQGASP